MRKNYNPLRLRSLFLVLFLSFCFTSVLKAQTVSSYGFSQSVGTYTAITGGSSLGTTTTDDTYFVDPAVLAGGTTATGVGFPIGFNFTYNGAIFDRIGINSNGWVALGQSASTPSINMTTTSAYTPLASTAVNTPAQFRSRIAGMGRDLQAQAGAELRIETIGAAPNRVCVIQWTNYKKFGTGGTGDNLNFQIRLNETSNLVQVIYGTIVFNATSNTADVGLGGTLSTDFNNRTTATDWNATTAGAANTDRCTMLNTVTAPVSGRTFTWTPPTPCSGAPTPGNTVASSNPACSGVAFTLSLQNNPAVSGLTYQWQSSPNGTTWTSIPGATGSTYSASQTTATYYQCLVSCSASTTASTPLQVTMGAPTSCYCVAGANSTAFEKISNVTLNTINNSSTGTAGYEDFTAISTSLAQSLSYPVTVSLSGAFATDQVIIFIDFNKNGLFTDPGETVYTSAQGVGPHSGTITIPAGALTGNTRMRVRMHDASITPNATPCGFSAYGQVEDYTVNIVSCLPGSFTTQPVNTTTVCTGNATFTVAASGTAPAYQWQESTTGAGGPWNSLSNNATYGGVTTNTLTLTGVPATFNGYQYRCVLTGTCTAATNSNAAVLTVTAPPAPTVFPAPPVSACQGTPQPISITTAAGFGAPVTVSFTSPTLNTSIPENVAGISNTLTVSGIPTGAVITAANVTLNIAHGYVGDVMISLKAPNNNILNLDNLLTGTNNPGVNFTNTVISSTGVTALSAGTQPWTGIFKADGNTGATGAFGVPSGPTGFAPNTPNFAGLYSVPNGPWTIAMYDAGPPDVGTLTNWKLTLTYTPIVPYAGTWSPTGGLFTDAAGTIPYTGTAVSTVYAKPPASTTYSVVIGSGACASPTTNVPVTVNIPVAITTNPANTSVCTDKAVSLSVTATGTGLSYQWQVSTDNGTTYNNVANGTNYAGATTNTLTVTAPPVSWNGFKYKVVVSGTAPCGPATSTVATLTVNPLPVINLSAAPYTRLFPGLTTTISTAVSPFAAATYTWFLNGIQIPGATAATYTANVDGLGAYSVRVTDVNGCTNTSGSINILDSVSSRLFIYPTPNNGQFQVRYYSAPANALPRYLYIYDSKGSRIYTEQFTVGKPYAKMDVDITRFRSGTYWVILADVNGNRLKIGRTIVP